jgi:hypothetical protein
MSLVSNWRRVLRYAWSIRLSALAGVLSAAEVVVQVFVDNPPIPRLTFAVLAGLVSLAAAAARFVAQRTVSGSAK